MTFHIKCRKRVAAKTHICTYCKREIQPGAPYYNVVEMDPFIEMKFHIFCGTHNLDWRLIEREEENEDI